MRILEQKMIRLLRSHCPGRCGRNTHVVVGTDDDGNTALGVILYGSLIAEYTPKRNSLRLTDAGYHTRTTLSRLRAIASEFAPHVIARKLTQEWKEVLDPTPTMRELLLFPDNMP